MAHRIVGLITARAGSKGVPRKNVAPLGGKPLIAWTMEAARRSASLERVIVSTDDPEVVAVAREYGVDVPFLRPRELADDGTPATFVVRHAVEWLAAAGAAPDYVVLLQPTSPFCTAEDIDGAVAVAAAKSASVVISVSEMHGHPSWIMRVDDNGRLVPWGDRGVADQRQDRDAAYMPNGAVFVVRADVALSDDSWYAAGPLPFVMPAARAIDIDTPWDLYVARLLADHGMGLPAAGEKQ